LIRNAFLISCLIGLFVYAVYPVAPPRLMTLSGYAVYDVKGGPVYGFEDTMAEYSAVDYQAESLAPFVNPSAAVPSPHIGWAFLIGIAVWLARRDILAALFAVLMPLVMLLAVVLTANHFIWDAVTRLAVCAFALCAAAALDRWPVP